MEYNPITSSNTFETIAYPDANIFRFDGDSNIEIRLGDHNIENRAVFLDYDLNLLSTEKVPEWDERSVSHKWSNKHPGANENRIDRMDVISVAGGADIQFPVQLFGWSAITLGEIYKGQLDRNSPEANLIDRYAGDACNYFFDDLLEYKDAKLSYYAYSADGSNNFIVSLFDSKVYVISDAEWNILDYVIDPSYKLQEGDSHVFVYIIKSLYTKRRGIIIWNDGDVASVITMRMRNPLG